CAAAAQYDRDKIAIAATHGGHQIEARGMDIARFDAVDPLDAAEQVVVVADSLAPEIEGSRGKIFVMPREALLNRATKNGLIARRGHLVVLRHAPCVAVHWS